jgi:hypothetical protein
VTLEGVALTGNSDYGIIMESYPFIARKLLREGRPEIQKALQEVLYSGEKGNSGLKLTRLLAILNNAAGSVSAKEGATFVDLDAVPEDGISLKEGLRYLLSDNAESLRNLLESEVDNVVDVISRQIFRRGVAEVLVVLTPPRPPALPFLGNIFPEPPSLEEVPLPILLPRVDENGVNRPSVGVMSLKDFTHLAAPKLSQDEEIYALGIADGAREFFGNEIGDLIKGERVLSIETIDVLLKGIRSGALGRSDILSSNSAKSVIDFVETALSVVRRGSQSRKDGVGSDYTEVLGSLSTTERARLDDIITELTQRALKRVTARLEKVDRLV